MTANRRWEPLLIAVLALLAAGWAESSVPLSSLPGVVIDDTAAELTGMWKPSAHVSPYVGDGYLHDDNSEKGEKSAKFVPELPKAGNYQVRVSYTPGKGRAPRVPVKLHTADGPKLVYLNQQTRPPENQPFVLVGVFRFEAGKNGSVTISNANTKGNVIVDAVQFLRSDDKVTSAESLAAAAKESAREAAAQELEPPKPTKTPLPSKPQQDLHQLTTAELDALVNKEINGAPVAAQADDTQFLRRLTLDLIGRQPTVEETSAFIADQAKDKRQQAIDRLLASDEFGSNWGNYWSDVIGYRVPPPELTFLNYYPLKGWLAEKLNKNEPWDSVVRDLLTASGKVGEHPAATFIGFHEANPTRLAAETSRVFLGVQIQCAECHDHPFEPWKRDQFHHLTAFFVRAKAKAPHNDSNLIDVTDKGSGEWQMPDMKDPRKKGPPMEPALLTGESFELGRSDLDRRKALAAWVASPENPWFAKAYTNRLWSRLLGKGFFEPVDNIGVGSGGDLEPVHEALASSFTASKFDVKEMFRLIVSSEAYGRALKADVSPGDGPLASAVPAKLRSDQIFDSLVTAIQLPNVKAEAVKPTAAIRFPPPPKSTRDLINDAFGFDPSLASEDVVRTLTQAMLLMNNDQLQAQVNADPASGTVLAKLLEGEKDDRKVAERLFQLCLARKATGKEVSIAVAHVEKLKDRRVAFEDVLWGLLNSAEFTIKR